MTALFWLRLLWPLLLYMQESVKCFLLLRSAFNILASHLIPLWGLVHIWMFLFLCGAAYRSSELETTVHDYCDALYTGLYKSRLSHLPAIPAAGSLAPVNPSFILSTLAPSWLWICFKSLIFTYVELKAAECVAQLLLNTLLLVVFAQSLWIPPQYREGAESVVSLVWVRENPQ